MCKLDKLLKANGLTRKDLEPKDRIGDVENAVIEVAEMSANNEVNIEDLTQAILELAELIGGE